MHNPRQIETIRTLAETAERESSRTVAERRRILDAEEQRLEQLRRYLAEYGDLSGSNDGVFIDTIRTRRSFMARIQAGIDQQEQLLRGLRAQLEHDLQQWRDARSHALALEKFDQRLDAQRSQKQQRREQAALDEVGQKMYSGA